ncbi:WD40-repeat-containing domain protein [Bombardia bombarda]|uniref:ASTRA-associated protein 1 n=1 Tax=Bombardia bombarda TaxID=252184 RepID=A0AA40C1T5_9PEZI|nr:WD40-repeat-containing domain protein [Bombardia bombarda]
MATEGQAPAPRAILRGHKAPVHYAAFIRDNQRLLTGDKDGFVISWDLTTMRPRAVWHAHPGQPVLAIAGWGPDKVITHGRNNKLVVWKLAVEDEARLSTTLPLDPPTEPRPDPWIVNILDVNTLNYCAFSCCSSTSEPLSVSSEVMIAVPNTLSSSAVDIFQLPTQARQHTIDFGTAHGIVFALNLSRQAGSLTLIAGFEDGTATVFHYSTEQLKWVNQYSLSKAHTEPVLSLDLSPRGDYFFTSGADDKIVRHPMPHITTPPGQESAPAKSPTTTISKPSTSFKSLSTKHSGQQSLRVRSDGLIFATAGWDAMLRVYSTKSLKEVAALKWHQVGCFAVAFAEMPNSAGGNDRKNDGNNAVVTPVSSSTLGSPSSLQIQQQQQQQQELQARGKSTTTLATAKFGDMSVKEKRIKQATSAHWLAAGAKDGRVSLWEIF